MDFTHAAYFGGPAQPSYQFIGVPPLTPSHSNNSAASDDFSGTSPPVEVYDQFPNGLPAERFQPFDSYARFNHANAFPGPPTPPNLQTAAQGPAQSTPALGGVGLAGDIAAIPKSENHDELAQGRRQGSNSEEDDLTPAQSRRKAQNRAAQRAFRERKERHVKDLEAKLASLEAAQQETASENERLKQDIQKISTENEILRATSSVHSSGSPASHNSHSITTGPMEYTPTDFYSDVLQNHPNKTPSHRIVTGDDGQRLLAAGATWDLIVNHELFKRGLVDLVGVSNRLKHRAKCDGQGPVFEERVIIEAIEQSAAHDRDELL
ncbi:hypothetical protein VTK73DRAFT_8935 [Phialemonium thermophilum]|uniref:BZIP domain-containing protein n=1 Tax=Phialemonium thermophilum TaxID=223376 RepID=A0ABR3Y5N9_9PEZI